MRRGGAFLALLLAATGRPAVAAPPFVNVPGLPEALIRIQEQALRQKLADAAPVPPAAAAGPDVSSYPVRGIDVSFFQGTIDWRRVAQDGYSFTFIKATEGASMTDPYFSVNWESAGLAGLYRGAYHFYNFCKDGPSQAANFIAQVPKVPDALPPVVDLEQSGSCGTLPAKAAFRLQLAAFLARLQAFYGKAPILYVNYSIYDRYLSGENDPYKIWIADYHHAAPLPTASEGWAFWQHSDHGRVAGIAGDVDLDVFNGTLELLAALSASTGTTVAEP